MIDIHCHLLPGIDDGPKNWDDSIDLARAMVADGITTAVATPHLIDGVYQNIREVVDPLVAQLNERLAQADIKLIVLAAAEVDLSSRHVTMDSPELPLIGGKSVLLEMPMAVIPHAMADILFSVRSRGILPVLAHPERNEILQDNPALAVDWIHAGAALQLDADSLLGVWGRRTKHCAEHLLRAGQFHAMASDAHSTARRPPRMQEALAIVREHVGNAAAQDLVTRGPAAILEGRVIDIAGVPSSAETRSHRVTTRHKRSWFQRITLRPRLR